MKPQPHAFAMPTTAQHPASRRAFTLIEMLTVMAVILLLATIILQVAKFAKLKAQTVKAKGEIEGYMAECTRKRTEDGRYPSSLSVGLDPWNNKYLYRLYTYPANLTDGTDTTAADPDELQYIIGSLGPDRAPGVKNYDDDMNDAGNIYKTTTKWNSMINGPDNTLWSELGYGDDIVKGDAPMYKRFYP